MNRANTPTEHVNKFTPLWIIVSIIGLCLVNFSVKAIDSNELTPKRDFNFTPYDNKLNFENSFWQAVIANNSYETVSNSLEVYKSWGINRVLYYEAREERQRSNEFVGIDAQATILIGETFTIVAFRGTEMNSRDLQSDLAIRKTDSDDAEGETHLGFTLNFRSLWKKMASDVMALPPNPIWVTGHSLGGAVAHLAILKLVTLFEQQKIKGIPYALTTFGSPKVGDKDFFQSATKKLVDNSIQIYRFRNIIDPVALIPLSKRIFLFSNYHHIGVPIIFDRVGNVISDSSEKMDNDLIPKEWYDVVMEDPDDLYKAHSMETYISNISRNIVIN